MGVPPRTAAARRAPHLPSFDAANRVYLRDANATSFKQTVGGHVDDTRGGKEYLTDTCTLRLSRSFNYSATPIPNDPAGMRTVTGRDRMNYAFAVREFKNWVIHRFGQPDIKVAGPPVARDQFAGKHGLIIFGIKFGNNPGQNWGATGHADLWDGATFYDELWGISTATRDFFDFAQGVSLWLMSGTGKVGA